MTLLPTARLANGHKILDGVHLDLVEQSFVDLLGRNRRVRKLVLPTLLRRGGLQNAKTRQLCR